MNIKAVITSLAFLAMPHMAQAGAYDDILSATNMGHTDKVIELLRRGMDVNTTDPQGLSLLMIAARGNNVELAKFLLNNRANVQRRNSHGDTALTLASFAGNKEIVRLLLERKPEINHGGWNALQYASYEGHSEIVTLLLAAGADINLKAPNGYSPLMLAAKRGHLDVVRTLTAAKADLTVKSDDATAISLARSAGNTDIVKHLESLGAH